MPSDASTRPLLTMCFLTLILAAVLGLGGCAGEAGPPAPEAELRLLFIGNSLTCANALPDIVAALARADGAVAVQTASVAFPDYSLDDHLVRGEASRRIAEGGWDIVILQQGPSALPASQAELVASTRPFAAECAPVGAKVALYMVWPSADRRSAFDSVSASYAAAAASVGGILLPAGDAWQAAWRADPTLPLYGLDGFHPSPAGSYLVALVIYQRLTGRSPIGLPASLTVGATQLELPTDQAETLQAAAAEANRLKP